MTFDLWHDIERLHLVWRPAINSIHHNRSAVFRWISTGDGRPYKRLEQTPQRLHQVTLLLAEKCYSMRWFILL
ncbi:hypothetical protein J6590_023206 [Homalodisca vitripennis]|nr:hypothetical protein J6590_023206 [Homalodisca vitripennis]